ncbi:hypothetical protein ACILDT_10825 [Capnocytophaga canis]|uniref:hypothetical protein n=1 Tax=Capnocytophaga canis TaxID=1848903 RepID=UPI0037D1032D
MTFFEDLKMEGDVKSMMPLKKRSVFVRLSKVRENGVCDEALSLQGFNAHTQLQVFADFAQPDNQNQHHTFYNTT